MPWNPNIPQPYDRMSDSQSDIKMDFETLSDYVSRNHVSFNDANQGKHNYSQFPIQTTDPSTNESEVGLFVKRSTQSVPESVPTISFKKSFVGPAQGDVYEFGRGLMGNTINAGWSRLPSGMLMKWDTRTISSSLSSNPQTYTFTWTVNNQFPVFNTTPVSIFCKPILLENNPGIFQLTVSISASSVSEAVIRVDSFSGGWNQFQLFILAIGT